MLAHLLQTNVQLTGQVHRALDSTLIANLIFWSDKRSKELMRDVLGKTLKPGCGFGGLTKWGVRLKFIDKSKDNPPTSRCA